MFTSSQEVRERSTVTELSVFLTQRLSAAMVTLPSAGPRIQKEQH